MASIGPTEATPAGIGAESLRGLAGAESPSNNRRLALSIAAVLCFEGFAMSINGIGSPWIAKSFRLGESGIAGLFAWISLSAIGSLGLSRMSDHLGRRRMLLACIAGSAGSALAAAFATNIVAFALCGIALFAFIRATIAGSTVILAEELAIEERARGQSSAGIGLGLGIGICLIAMPILVEVGVGACGGGGSRYPVLGFQRHLRERPLATRRRLGYDCCQQLLRWLRKGLSASHHRWPGLCAASQHRRDRSQYVGVLSPGLGRGFGARHS